MGYCGGELAAAVPYAAIGVRAATALLISVRLKPWPEALRLRLQVQQAVASPRTRCVLYFLSTCCSTARAAHPS